MKSFRRTASVAFFSILSFCWCDYSVQAQTPSPAPQIASNGVKIERAAENTSNEAREEKKTAAPLTAISRVGIDPSQTRAVTLNEAIRRALENNNDIEVARGDVRVAETQLRSLLGVYDPVITVSPNFSRNSTTGSGASNDFRVDSNFSQLIRRGGGNYNVFFNNSQTGSNSSNNQNFNQTSQISGGSGTTYFSNLGVSYTQPLFRNRQIDPTRRQIRIQRRRLEQTDAEFRRLTTETISRVQQAYWDLVFALRDQQNRVANLNLSRENLRQVEARIAAGSAAPLERAEVSTELANREADVLIASQQVSIAENSLKTLLLREPTSPEWNEAIVPTDQPVFGQDTISLNDAIKDAVDNRPELRRLRLQREINRIDIEYFRNQTKPRVDLNSTFSLGGLSIGGLNNTTTVFPIIVPGIQTNADSFLLNQINFLRAGQNLPPVTSADIPTASSGMLPGFLSGGTTRSLQNLFRTDSPSFSVGVTFSFPLRNRTAKADLEGARIQEQQIEAQARGQEQIIIAEVRNAVQSVETSRQRVLIARRGRENAEIQLAGERKLYEVGRSTTFLLFQRENALANARNAEIRAETDYNKALAELQRSTSTTFRTNNIEVDSPVDDK